MLYLYIKSLHIIFVVTWFAGLFYIVRLFIYQIEANAKPENEQFILKSQYRLMTSRLWSIITVPSMWLTLITGFYLMIDLKWYHQPWMIIKLGLLVGLVLYHFLCGRIKKQLEQDVFKYSSSQMRIWNEVATLFLFAIVFLVVLKNGLNMIYGLIGLVLLAVMLMIGIRIYNISRSKKGEQVD